MVNRDDRASIATGTFSCGALSKDPFLVQRGSVQFFSADVVVSDGARLAYQLVLLGTDGQMLHLNGYRSVDTGIAFSAAATWRAATTLLMTLTRPDGSLVGRGKLHVSWRNFAGELRGFSAGASLRALTGLMARAVQLTAGYFFAPLRPLQYPVLTTAGDFPKVPPAASLMLTAVDSVESTMYMWLPTSSPPSIFSSNNKPPILLLPGMALDHQQFALPTIETNTVEFLTDAGYTVYCATPRYGRSSTGHARDGHGHDHTMYDARLDVKAAMDHVRARHGTPMYVVAHCAGAGALAMGLLDGSLPAAWLCGATASQTFANPKLALLNTAKARAALLFSASPAARLLPSSAAFRCVPAAAHEGSSLLSTALDQALRFYPSRAGEACDSATCHRAALAFGQPWAHAQLNRATHAGLGRFIGSAHPATLAHAARMGTAAYVMDNSGNSLVTGSNLARLRGLPFLFVSGAASDVYSPESTDLSYSLLRDQFGAGGRGYQRLVLDGYGHHDVWIGKRAKVDVYPRVLEHVEWCVANAPNKFAAKNHPLPPPVGAAVSPARVVGGRASAGGSGGGQRGMSRGSPAVWTFSTAPTDPKPRKATA